MFVRKSTKFLFVISENIDAVRPQTPLMCRNWNISIWIQCQDKGLKSIFLSRPSLDKTTHKLITQKLARNRRTSIYLGHIIIILKSSKHST
jgi:hypothetical protein